MATYDIINTLRIDPEPACGVGNLITTADLKTQTRQDLASMAREMGVPGWHSMRKDELIDELKKIRRRAQRKLSRQKAEKPKPSTARRQSASTSSRGTKPQKSSSKKSPNIRTKAAPKPSSQSTAKASPLTRVGRLMKKQRAEMEQRKDLSATMLVNGTSAKNKIDGTDGGSDSDRVVLIVRDSYWVQASWEVQRASVERAKAALAEQWHAAVPVLRLIELGDGGSCSTEEAVRDIPIHGGVNNWYVDVVPGRYQVLLGYLSEASGRFFTLCRSNIVEPPQPGSCDAIDGHWKDIAEDYERIYALSGGNKETVNPELRSLFEDRLRRRLPEGSDLGFGPGADLGLRRERGLPFDVDAELIVYGSTTPGTSVTLGGEPVKLQADGTFTVRMDLPDRRQVIPVVASSRDGLQQRTTVVAVERNTKVMEPVSHDTGIDD